MSLLLCFPYSIINKAEGAAQVASFYCGLSLVHPQRVISVNTVALLWGAVEKYSMSVHIDCLWQVIVYLSFTTMEKHRQVVTVELNASILVSRVIFVEGMW